MEVLIIFLIAFAGKDVWEAVKADFQRSKSARLAEVAKSYPGGIIPAGEQDRLARHHAIGYAAGEVLHGFPVARTGLHAGWLAHRRAHERVQAIRDGVRGSSVPRLSWRDRVRQYRDARPRPAGTVTAHGDPDAEAQHDRDEALAGAACIFCGERLGDRDHDGLAHLDCAQADEAADHSAGWDDPLPAGWENPAADPPAGTETDQDPGASPAPGDDTGTNPNGDTQMPDTMIGAGPDTTASHAGFLPPGVEDGVDGDAGTDLASTKGASGGLKGLSGTLIAQIDGIIGNLLQNHADPNVIGHFEQMQELATELGGLADQSGALLGGVHTDIADSHAAAGGEDHVADTGWYAEA